MNRYQSEPAHPSTPCPVAEISAALPRQADEGQPLGLRIRKIRLAAGISVREMAQRLGVSRSTVQRYEARKTLPKRGTLVAIAEILGIDVNMLLGDQKKGGSAIPAKHQALLQDKLHGFIDRLDRADLSPNNEAALCQALGYLIDIFGGIAGNWSEADRELRTMNVLPELSAQDNAVRNAAINELFRRKMTCNTENIRKIAECLPFLWGEEAESCLEAMRQAAGIPAFHFHLLRHTYTTNLMRGGASPRDVQELLGHAELATTMNVYAHSNEEEKRRAACLLDQLDGVPGDEEKYIQNLSETV